MADVKITRRHMVTPAEPTSEGVITLTELDQVAGAAYVPTVYFYKPYDAPTPIFDTLKDSLSHALVPYYPLAGRLHQVEGGGRLELHCNAMGVELIEAESSSQLEDFGDFSDAQKFQRLTPFVDRSKAVDELPLYLVQLTYLRCGGLSLGIMISHAVADGIGSLCFITDWARLARGEPVEVSPSHDRTILRAGEPPKELPCLEDTSTLQKSSLISQQEPKETTMIMLPLSKVQVEKLKKAANVDNDSPRPYSRFEVLAAHIWRCACKATGHDGEETNALGFGIDLRRRIRPALPPNFWGNALMMVATKSPAGELVSEPLGSGCSRVRRAIEKVTNEYIWSDIERLKNQDLSVWRGLRAVEDGSYVYPNVLAISWLTLPIYGLDFGWGKEIHMGPATHTHEGNAMILSGRGEEGSVVVAFCLQVAHVEEFKHHFYQGIVAEN